MKSNLNTRALKKFNPFPENFNSEERIGVLTSILIIFQKANLTIPEISEFENEFSFLGVKESLQELLKRIEANSRASKITRLKSKLLNKNNLFYNDSASEHFPVKISEIKQDIYFFVYNFILSSEIDTYKSSNALQELQEQLGIKLEDHYLASSRYRSFSKEESSEEALTANEFSRNLSNLVKKFNLREHIGFPFTQVVLKQYYSDLKPEGTLSDTFFRFLNYTSLPVCPSSTLNIPKARRILIYRLAAGLLEGLNLPSQLLNREHKNLVKTLRLKLSFSYEVIKDQKKRIQGVKELSLIEMSYYLTIIISFYKEQELNTLERKDSSEEEIKSIFYLFEEKLTNTTKQSCMETSFFILFEFCIEQYKETKCWSISKAISILSSLYDSLNRHDVILRGVSTIILFSSLINSKYILNNEVLEELKEILHPSLFELEGIKNASNIKEHREDLIKVLFEYDFRNNILKNKPSSNQLDFLDFLAIELENKLPPSEEERKLNSNQEYWNLYICSLNKYLDNEKFGSEYDKVFLNEKELKEFGLDELIYSENFKHVKRHVEIDLNSKINVADKIDYRGFKKTS